MASCEGGSYYPGPHQGNCGTRKVTAISPSAPSILRTTANERRDICLDECQCLLTGFGWQAGDALGGTRPCVTGVSVKRDWSQTESATFLCESLLSSAPFPFTLSCLPLSPRSLLLTSWEIPSARAECPQPSCWVLHPEGSLRPTWLLSLSPSGLNAELRVLVQPPLFFRSKLGNGVRSKSTRGRADGNGVGTDKWEPHLTSKPKCAYSWTSCLTSPFIGTGAKQLVSLIWPVLSPIICLISTKQFDKWNQ